ncbi:MAG: PfkB family carbohydrate kinase [Candidatus Izemoplasmatales bacterium]
MEFKKLELIKELKNKNPKLLNLLIGFDGFVDEIIHAVDKRMDTENFKRIETIEDLAKRIQKASGLSTNVELVPLVKKIGGNGPIMCNAMSETGANITYVGSLGYPTLNDVFHSLEQKVNIYTIANPGHSDALEFNDGKLILGKMNSLNEVTYDRLIEVVGLENLKELIYNSDMFATVNWVMLPYMTDLWKKLLKNVIAELPKKNVQPFLFVDLADPEKREDEEIIEALNLLKEFNGYFRVILGLNKKEAYDVANVLNLFDDVSLRNMQVSLEDLNQALYDYLGIYSVVIHPVDRSCLVVEDAFYEEVGPYVEKPKLTTGAGDNFNAGFMLGMLLGLKPNQALLTGMSTSGFYVRNARSPKFEELISFIEDWQQNLI